MKPHIIYMSLGILTLVLNLTLTLHIITKQRNKGRRSASDCDEIITFSLKGEGSSDNNATESVLYEDTVAL